MDRIEAEFIRFHTENPHVYNEIKAIALDLKKSGVEFYGIKAIFEIVRFHRIIKTSDPAFKLNNNFTALYSRMLMENEEELDGFFRTRVRKPRYREDQHNSYEDTGG